MCFVLIFNVRKRPAEDMTLLLSPDNLREMPKIVGQEGLRAAHSNLSKDQG